MANAQEPTSLPMKPRMQWCPPSLLPFKDNFDAALFSKENLVGVGVVIRDGGGLPIAALCKHVHYLCNVVDSEALAAHKAVQFALEVGLSEVEMEGGSLLICNALKDRDPCFASFGNIIEDTLALAGGLQRVVISHVKRDGNKAAHILARQAAQLSCDCLVWLEDVPEFLESVILSEMI
jgi:ribonuclease HI